MDETSHYKLLLVDWKGAVVITLGFYVYCAANHAFDLGLKKLDRWMNDRKEDKVRV